MTSTRYGAVKSHARWISVAALGLCAALISTGARAQNLQVQDVETHTAIATFAYVVNLDNTADSFDPNPKNHPGERPMPSYSPIVSAGDQAHTGIKGADGINPLPLSCPTSNVPPEPRPCKYFVSVRAPGYKLWGAHFKSGDPTVLVELKKEPLPLSKLVVKVFEDFAPVNGFPDFPLEIGPEGGPATTDMSGFQVIIEDILGQVSVDFNGSPICGTGVCLTNAQGDVTIPNLGFGKYNVHVRPPAGPQQWVQTTSFEGTQGNDAWLEEGTDGNGAPRELLAEPFVQTANFFGFTRAMNPPGGSGSVTGKIRNYVEYPPNAQLTLGEPVYRPWIAVTDVGNTDQQIARVRGNADGTFKITGLPPGTYQLAVWDDPLDYIMAFYTVVVAPGGATVDMGDMGIFRWFGWLSGHVFMDKDCNLSTTPNAVPNANCGVYKAGVDTPIANFPMDIRARDAAVLAETFTDTNGFYQFPEVLSPMGKFMIGEVGFTRFGLTGESVHNERFANTGQGADTVTRLLEQAGGDLLTNQRILEGHRSIVDWGKRNYLGTETGQIVGITFYDTTRNEFDARLEVAESYEPAIPGVTVRLWGVGADNTPNTNDDVLVNEYITDGWKHPSIANGNGCDVRDKNGAVVPGPTPKFVADNCIEVPQLGNETKDGAFDGGYAFAKLCTVVDSSTVDQRVHPNGDADGDGIPNNKDPDPILTGSETCVGPIPPADYITQVVPPPFYQITAEEDINVDEGSALAPLILPPPCVGNGHVVNRTTGAHSIPSPYQGQNRPLCDKRLVTLAAGQNANSDFFLFTDMDADPSTKIWSTEIAVPPAGRFFGLIEDDLDLNTDPNSITYGEKRSVEGAPVGVRDYTFRKLTTVYADENGFYEVMVPSTFSMYCPVPGGVCPGMIVLTVNDPGDPGHPDPFFRPSYLTEPAVFDAWPARMTPTDTPIDPVETGASCKQNVGIPEILQVSTPYGSSAGGFSIDITGADFGTASPPTATLGGTPLTVSYFPGGTGGVFVDKATVQVPNGFTPGPQQLLITNNETHKTSVAGMTIHVLGAGYNPHIVTVTSTIQAAINSAVAGDLIIVPPGTYQENVILSKPVKLQGYGPGGSVGAPETEFAGAVPPGEDPFKNYPGSVIDGRYFTFDQSIRDAWHTTLAGISYNGPTAVPEGAAITVLAKAGEFDAIGGFKAQIDGLGITSGRGFGGGGIHVHAYAANLQITNNIIDRNQSGHGGGIAIGRPVSESGGDTSANYHNPGIGILHNRILRNGGVRYAGGVGIFNGADNYEVGYNDFCGNASSAYGGGISHFGLSQNGRIHHNRVYFNDAFDSGGGIQIAGDQFPTLLGVGSGNVKIEDNLIQFNKSNDDGGGISLLRPLAYQVDLVNNLIDNNVATDIGGGVSLDDASNVTMVNNSIARNVSTATAADRDLSSCHPPAGSGLSCPHSAGVISAGHSAEFQATLPAGSPTYSDPLMFNNVFWQNQAYYFNPAGGPEGSGLPLNMVPAGVIDLEVFGGAPTDVLHPKYSSLTTAYAGADGTNVIGLNPLFVDPINLIQGIDLQLVPNRLNPSEIIVEFLRITPLLGDYHLQNTSPVRDLGVLNIGSVNAPADDIDGDLRAAFLPIDLGADEVGAAPPPPPPPVAALLYFSTAGNVAIPGVGAGIGIPTYDDADIYKYDSAGHFSRVFDASVAGLAANANIDALYVADPNTFYMSFNRAAGTTVPGVGVVQDEDIVRYNAITNTWTLYFDGSDVGLGSATGSGLVGENVDAFTILPDGSVVVSTSGSATATGLAGTFTGQDLLRCIGSFGPTTTCSWSLYFKGSNVGLTTATENIDGVTVFGNNVVLSTASTFSVTGLSGSGSDVFACKAVTTGPATACGSFGMYFNGSAHGVTNNIDAFYSTRDPATLPAAGVLKAAAASPASASSPQPQVVK